MEASVEDALEPGCAAVHLYLTSSVMLDFVRELSAAVVSSLGVADALTAAVQGLAERVVHPLVRSVCFDCLPGHEALRRLDAMCV